MATKKKMKEQENPTEVFFNALGKISEETGLDREELLTSLEDAINQAYDAKYVQNPEYLELTQSSPDSRIVEIDRETGAIAISAVKNVVETVEDPTREVSLEEAQEYDPEFQVGDEYLIDITPTDFVALGRIVANQIKSLLVQKVTEKEKIRIKGECANLVGEIVTCDVESIEEYEIFDDRKNQKIKKRRVYVRFGKVDGVIEDKDQLPNDQFRIGAKVKAVLLPFRDDRMDGDEKAGRRKSKDKDRDNTLKLSRTCDTFLRRMLEQEIPEVKAGIVEVKSVARKPGLRSKIAVVSHHDGIDAISACIGERGNRIQNVVDELGGEKIDVVKWSADLAEFVANSLSPAKVDKTMPISVEDDERDGKKKGKVAYVTVTDDQLTLAIGNKGINVSLAATLCKCRIDIKATSDSEGAGAKDRGELSSLMM